LGQGTQNSHVLLERFEESRLVPAFFYLAAVGVVLATALDSGFSHRGWNALQVILIVLLSIPAAFLLIASLIGLISYFIFLPSISQDSHLFLRAHASHLIHPLKTSIVLGLAVLCVFTRSQAGWAIWMGLPMIHAFQTFLIIRRARREHPISEPTGSGDGTLQLLLNLVLGTEIVTAASGVKGLSPWRLDTMSEDTWMIDVRTKAEFHWNRLQGAENYPWGKGIIEAAQGKSKERPVLIICLTGHRSPSVAVTLRKLGFKSVYHLTWGLLYLILLERDGKRDGPFSFVRFQPNSAKRDEDLKGISIGYLTLAAIMLIVAPLEKVIRGLHLPAVQMTLGAMIGLAGLTLVVVSYRALGKNFRVFAAPRRNGKLVTSGIYSKVRHPMYTGAILLLGGWVLFFGSLWGAPLWLAFSTLYFVKSVREERILNERFPEYGEYRKRTWKFLPYVY
jgi:protein-S-isoprenylcysteine O-methyltransferase Ste14/rhodanese-related sulfurtransferase